MGTWVCCIVCLCAVWWERGGGGGGKFAVLCVWCDGSFCVVLKVNVGVPKRNR